MERHKIDIAWSFRGESVVIAMWSTGESVTEAVAERHGERAAQLAGFASAPKEVGYQGNTMGVDTKNPKRILGNLVFFWILVNQLELSKAILVSTLGY